MPSSKPETTFYRHINKLLPETIHYEKMHNVYVAGIPDFYYEGWKDVLWVEYKWVGHPPVRDTTLWSLKKHSPKSWPGQEAWLLRAHKNGVPVRVIVGLPYRNALIIPPEWFDREWTIAEIQKSQVCRESVRQEIIAICGGEHAD